MEKPANRNLLVDQDGINIGSLRNNAYPANAYSYSVQPEYNGSYENGSQMQRVYPYVSTAGLETASHGMHGELSSLPFDVNGFRSETSHRPFAPLSTRPRAVWGSGHMSNNNGRHFCTNNSDSHQRTIPPNDLFTSPNQFSLIKSTEHDSLADEYQFGQRANISSSFGSYGRCNDISGDHGRHGMLPFGVDDFGVTGLQSEWTKRLQRKCLFSQLSSQVASVGSMNTLAVSSDDFGMGSQRKGSCNALESGFSYRGYPYNQSDRGSNWQTIIRSGLGTNNHTWPTLDEASQGGRYSEFSCSYLLRLDTQGERNRGPRASRSKCQTTNQGCEVNTEPYNGHELLTNYENAKFYVIKSYSEDNIHRSIKYGVWASTPNGNKKLDAAYSEVKEKEETCPIFLLFSVNASAQFCGVAEMIGPVDFDKNVEHWLQNKWSGHFPVKWHIIKDVPNSHFRHILLQNNDNKPVTNSRDTQEVCLDQGVEILNIFKKYEQCTSILDDFHFYEERQKAMQDKKAKQQQQSSSATKPVPVVAIERQKFDQSFKKMTKSFAEALVFTDTKDHKK